MNIKLEPIPYPPGQSFVSIVFEVERFLGPYHRHPEIELVAIDSSTGRMVVGDFTGTFRKGDLFLIGENIPHIFQNSGLRPPHKARAHVIQFRRDFAGEAIFRTPEMAPVLRLLQASNRGLRVTGAMRERVRNQMDSIHAAVGPKRVTALLDLLADLSQPRTCKPLASTSYDPASFPTDDRTVTILSYIQENFTQPISVPEIAKKVGLTPNAFSRYFRQMTQHTFTEFLNDLRVKEVSRLLQETNAPVTEIAFSCGFGNLPHFHNEFRKRVKLSPGKYRKMIQLVQPG